MLHYFIYGYLLIALLIFIVIFIQTKLYSFFEIKLRYKKILFDNQFIPDERIKREFNPFLLSKILIVVLIYLIMIISALIWPFALYMILK